MHEQSQAVGAGPRTTTSRPTTSCPAATIFGIGGGIPRLCSSPGFGNNCQNTPWFVLMLPYIEQAPLYNSFNASIGMEGPNVGPLPGGFIINSTVYTTRIASFQCPSDNRVDLVLSMSGIFQLPWSGHQGELRRQLGKPGLRPGASRR